MGVDAEGVPQDGSEVIIYSYVAGATAAECEAGGGTFNEL
jgi:hypothetical protein